MIHVRIRSGGLGDLRGYRRSRQSHPCMNSGVMVAAGRRLQRWKRGVIGEKILGTWSARPQERRQDVITLDDLEDSYPDDGDQCYYCGRKWDSHSCWEFFYLDNHLLCKECALKYRRASPRETKQPGGRPKPHA
jgi:hypothetical protein